MQSSARRGRIPVTSRRDHHDDLRFGQLKTAKALGPRFPISNCNLVIDALVIDRFHSNWRGWFSIFIMDAIPLAVCISISYDRSGGAPYGLTWPWVGHFCGSIN